MGLTHYDNMLCAILTTFEIITLEGWTDTMYTIRRANNTYLYDIFFVACVVFGTFFVLNLMIAVQFSNLEKAFEESERLAKLAEQKAKEEELESQKRDTADESVSCSDSNEMSQEEKDRKRALKH